MMTSTTRKPFSAEAQNIAYKTGIRELAPLMDRIIELETQVAALATRLDALEQAHKNSTPIHLAKVERR